eukprot:jgi/Ulvmu1/11304/UM074_0019.1
MSCVKFSSVLSTTAQCRISVAARSLSEDAATAANERLQDRVSELREDQLSEGTNDVTKIMKVTGPAPELVNGRLAMVGFTAGVSAEITSHQTVAKQFADAPGLIIAVTILLTTATLIPIIRGNGTLDEGVGEGIRPGAINVTNELINGRAAMLGMSALIAYEWVTGAPLF